MFIAPIKIIFKVYIEFNQHTTNILYHINYKCDIIVKKMKEGLL